MGHINQLRGSDTGEQALDLNSSSTAYKLNAEAHAQTLGLSLLTCEMGLAVFLQRMIKRIQWDSICKALSRKADSLKAISNHYFCPC